MAEHNFYETPNIYPNLNAIPQSDQQRLSLNKTLSNKFELPFLFHTRELLILTNLMMLISDLSSEFLYHVQISCNEPPLIFPFIAHLYYENYARHT